MKKKKKGARPPKPKASPPKSKPENLTATATDTDKLLLWLSELKTNCKAVITGKEQDAESDARWLSHIAALEQATAIISALQDEGITDPEQVKDLITDYRAQARTHQAMWQKYETPKPMIEVGAEQFCPDCRTKVNPTIKHCRSCGRMLEPAGRK